MKKVTIPTEIQGIDWSKPQWVIRKETCEVILTTGKHTLRNFSGTCLPCSAFENGDYDTEWRKDKFQLLTTDIPFTISNSNE